MGARKYRLREAIKQWPESDRPREKLASRGAVYLSDSELLAILVGSGSGKKNALDIARTLINTFETLAGLESEITKVNLGPKGTFYRLKAGPLADKSEGTVEPNVTTWILSA